MSTVCLRCIATRRAQGSNFKVATYAAAYATNYATAANAAANAAYATNYATAANAAANAAYTAYAAKAEGNKARLQRFIADLELLVRFAPMATQLNEEDATV